MTLDDRILDLLQRWEELREQGQTITPEELCKNSPELLEEFKRNLEDLHRVDKLVSTLEGQADHRDDQLEVDSSAFINSNGPTTNTASRNELEQRYVRPAFHAAGGLGEVYKAQDAELGRQVALKRMKSDVARHTESRRRFLREAEITGRLEHPGIVPVYGLVQDDDGQPCYAMRFIEGESLKDAIQRFHKRRRGSAGRPMSAGEEVLEFRKLLNHFIAACHTVAYAHSRGVLHRDLKPANIMLGPYGETLVVDWGLAKVIAKGPVATTNDQKTQDVSQLAIQPLADSGDSDLTQAGRALGTPAFMSPEQAAGRLDQLAPASDVYSLGATLSFLLTGKPPFGESDPGQVLQKVLKGSFSSPRQINRHVPRVLEAICLKAMELKPENRYPSAEALAEEIEHWLADEAVTAYREPLSARFGRWVRHHKPMTVSVAAAAILALTMGLSLFLISAEKDRTKEQATLVEKAENEKYFHYIARAQAGWREAKLAGVEELLDSCRPEDRKWEWGYLKALCNRDVRTLKGHSGSVVAVTFSSDGTRLASGSVDGSVKIWDAATGSEARTLCAKKDVTVWCVKLSPDGTKLASGSADGFLRIWDSRTGRLLLETKAGLAINAEPWKKAVRALDYSSDGTRVVSGHEDGTVLILDTQSGGKIDNFEAGGSVRAIAFSPDSKLIAVSGHDPTVEIWDVATRKELRSFKGHSTIVEALAFNQDNGILASGGEDRTVKLWDLNKGIQIRTMFGHSSDVTGVAFNPDGTQLASASLDGSVKFWAADTGEEVRSYKGHTAGVRGLSFSPDGTKLATASADQTVRIWNATVSQEAAALTEGQGYYTSVAFSPDSNYLLSNNARILELMTRLESRHIQANAKNGSSTAAAFSPTERQFATASSGDWIITIWDAIGGNKNRTLGKHDDRVFKLVFSPDGQHLASISSDGYVKIWETTGERPPLIISNSFADGRDCLAYSPDGTRIAAVSKGQGVRILDARTGKEVFALRGHTGPANAVAYSPKGRYIASGGSDGTICIWDGQTGTPIRTIPGHSSMVWSVAFSPDEKRLASASGDQTVKLWDILTGLEMLTLAGHKTEVYCVAFSPDGERLVSSGSTILLWEADDGTDDRKAEREAVDLLGFLLAKPLRKSDALEYIRNSGTVSPQAVEVALNLADRFHEETDAERYYQSSWITLRKRFLNSVQYRFALRQAKAALSLAPSTAKYRTALGIAQYRLDLYQEALATLSNANSLDPETPANLAILAMTRKALNQKEAVQESLSRLKEAMKLPKWARDSDALAIQREAEEVVGAEGRSR